MDAAPVSTTKDASSIRYKGYKSPTLHLVLLGFISGTGLLVGGYIDMHVWNTSVLGLLSGYVVASGISKAAEAYSNRNTSLDVRPTLNS